MTTEAEYKIYMSYRRRGIKPPEAFRRLEHDGIFDWFRDTMIFTEVAILLLGIVAHKRLPRKCRSYYLKSIAKVWVLPPTGDPIELPLYTAIRLVKRRGWSLAVTEPKRTISRRQAFKILVSRDKKHRKATSRR